MIGAIAWWLYVEGSRRNYETFIAHGHSSHLKSHNTENASVAGGLVTDMYFILKSLLYNSTHKDGDHLRQNVLISLLISAIM